MICSYLFMSIAYGMLMTNAGYSWYWTVLISTFVYTGAFQYVMITLLAGGASALTVALTALLVNSRQVFYSLTMMDTFKKMKGKLLYMIHSLTDETYAIDITLMEEQDEEYKQAVMFYAAVISHLSWILGTLVGSLAGEKIPWDMEGIDFCMTALFITIVMDQQEHTNNHIPALIGGLTGVVCLFLFGSGSFILPSLILTSGFMIVMQRKMEENI